MAKRKNNKSGIPGVRGVRTEGWLLKEPCKRMKEKSYFLLKLEEQQELKRKEKNKVSKLSIANKRAS